MARSRRTAAKVEGTLPTSKAEIIGARIRQDDDQLRRGRGPRSQFLPRLRQRRSIGGTAGSPRTGRALELLTDQPGLQFYQGNF
jgi:aldose 1-epimerase